MRKTVKIGAATIGDLEEATLDVPSPGIGGAFSLERACGKAIEQVRYVCRGMTLPSADDAVITYVLCDDLQAEAVAADFGRLNYLFMADRSIKFSSLKNRVVLLSRSGNAGAVSRQAFSSLSEQGAAIYDWNLQNASAIAFQLGAPSLTLFPLGIGSDQVEERNFGTVPSLFSGDELDKALDHFDNKWANAPSGHKKLWATFMAETHVPCAETEKVIQEHLQLYLIGVDRSMIVVDEIPNASGRADLHLYSPATDDGSAVLELKVLRYCSHPKTDTKKITKVPNATNKKNAEEVVKQAAEYKDELQTERALARLYDMRKDPLSPKTTEVAQQIAEDLGVELVISRIHYSSQEKRNAKVAKKLEKKQSSKKAA